MTSGGTHMDFGAQKAEDYTPEEQRKRLEALWHEGGQEFQLAFSDQHTNLASNEIIAKFVRDKIRSAVKDPAVAEKLCPDDHPICSRRLILDIGYYETFNRRNVRLVDVRAHPIERITETAIQTADGAQYEVDLIIFALGFDAFTGALNKANIRNEKGETPADRWRRGPRTLLGITATGFPNLFMPTGAGSPSLLGNPPLQNEFQIDWIADCIAYMAQRNLIAIEPSEEAEAAWTDHVAEISKKLLRLQVNNYMVHGNEDGSRVYLPYGGGLSPYIRSAREVAAKGYEGYRFTERRTEIPRARTDSANQTPLAHLAAEGG
jgi:cation diffusion facilitator CzcD-associated flavoprotein CzcO